MIYHRLCESIVTNNNYFDFDFIMVKEISVIHVCVLSLHIK